MFIPVEHPVSTVRSRIGGREPGYVSTVLESVAITEVLFELKLNYSVYDTRQITVK